MHCRTFMPHFYVVLFIMGHTDTTIVGFRVLSTVIYHKFLFVTIHLVVCSAVHCFHAVMQSGYALVL